MVTKEVSVEDIKCIVGDEPIDEYNIVSKTIPLMKEAESRKDLSGSDKKNYVMVALYKLVESGVEDVGKQDKLKGIMDKVIPSVIDNLVAMVVVIFVVFIISRCFCTQVVALSSFLLCLMLLL